MTKEEEDNKDENDSPEKEECDCESEAKDMGDELAHSKETVKYGKEESSRDMGSVKVTVEPRESDSLMLAKMLDMMMQNQLEAN